MGSQIDFVIRSFVVYWAFRTPPVFLRRPGLSGPACNLDHDAGPL